MLSSKQTGSSITTFKDGQIQIYEIQMFKMGAPFPDC